MESELKNHFVGSSEGDATAFGKNRLSVYPSQNLASDPYHYLAEQSHDLLCTHDLQGRLRSVSPAPARLLGYTVQELLQIPMRQLIVPEYRCEFDEYLVRVEREGGRRAIWPCLRGAGKSAFGNITTSCTANADRNPSYGALRMT